MRFLALLAVTLALVGCPMPAPDPGPQPGPWTPVPPAPPAPPTPPPDPTPVPPQPDEAVWDAVTVGMTEAQVVATVGQSKHRSAVGPGYLAMGYYVRIDGKTRYVEAVFGADSKVSTKVVW